MKKIITALFCSVLCAGSVFAAENNDRQLIIDQDSMMIQELPVPAAEISRHGGVPGNPPQLPPPGGVPSVPSIPSVPSVPPPPQQPTGPSFGENINNSSQVVALIDQIVNLVDKIFGIIAKNQPVVNINVNYANAVPYGVSHWTQLQGWKEPAVKRYQITYKNALGAQVVKVVYQLHYTYGGNLNGQGQFLTGVTIEPISVDTAWGYNVDMTAEVPDSTIVNVGTTENPIAGMQVQLRYKIHTIMSDVQDKVIFYVQGNGLSKNLTPSKGTAKKMENAKKKIQNIKF